jgi:hypothetical protein
MQSVSEGEMMGSSATMPTQTATGVMREMKTALMVKPLAAAQVVLTVLTVTRCIRSAMLATPVDAPQTLTAQMNTSATLKSEMANVNLPDVLS